MPTFVDFAGMNTLVSSSIDGNTLSSGKNTRVADIQNDELVGINLHRNGPYGYSTWKQLRVSENPITRHHKENSTMTFVVQPGPVRNVLPEGELRVRDRYSALYTFTEPAIAKKAYPLVWNVGRHFKDENGNVDLENPERFSIISSFGNQNIGFANNEVDKHHRFDPDEEKSEYREIYKLYAEGGLNDQKSPLTHWEFLQYRETVFPHMKNQFQNENLERPNFESFYRHNRPDRTKTFETSSFGYHGTTTGDLSQSSWVLDEHEEFLSRSYSTIARSHEWGSSATDVGDTNAARRSSANRAGEGSLMTTLTQFWDNISTEGGRLNGSSTQMNQAKEALDNRMSPGPLYMRRISIPNKDSTSNPSGMHIYGTGSSSNTLFQGGALWQAGENRYIKDTDGNYISAPKQPFYDTYENYIEEARRKYKNFSIVPEFRMSTQVEDYLTNGTSIELDMFEVTGGAENSQNSSQAQFYEIYSNSDFMRQFELINEDHKEFTNGKVLSLRCKAIKKFLPYEGFYPAQRTADLAQRFYDSFKDFIKVHNSNGVEINDFNFGTQMVMTPLFAPGVLFNTIKSGVAVDYPIISGSLDIIAFPATNPDKYLINTEFNKRIPFEAIIEPDKYISQYKLTSNEPHISGNLSASAEWTGDGDGLYSMMSNNFFAESINFFLPSGQLTSVVSKKQKDITLTSGSVYGMRVKMRRSMNGARGSVYHFGKSSNPYLPPQDVSTEGGLRETFTLYSRPSAFGPPSRGQTILTKPTGSLHEPSVAIHNFAILNRFDTDSTEINSNQDTKVTYTLDSRRGYNYPFTPPYYHGEAWCHITFTASSDSMTIREIQETASYEYLRYDNSFISVNSSAGNIYGIDHFVSHGPQGLGNINKHAVQLSASLNLKGIGQSSIAQRSRSQNLVVDSGLDESNRWIIQTKFETPMLNFAHVSGSSHLTLPVYGSGSVPRGIWHQHGRIPEENEGVFLEVGPIPENYQIEVMQKTSILSDLSEALGFAGSSTKIGRLRSSKTIYEAVVAVPFIEQEGRKKFFSLDPNMVKAYKDGGEARSSLTTGDPQDQIGRSVLSQLQKMEKYIFPPSFDFLNNSIDEVKPIAMYIFEFSHTLSQQDLSDIWQNLPPDIGTEMEESEVAITHPLLKKELLGEGGESGNTLIDMPNKLRWMVFKVKQRAASNYFKKTVLRNPEVNTDVDSGNVTVDEFGDTSGIQYNWPYDFFSLVELVKLDAEVEFGNFRDEDIANYTTSIPPYEAQQADMDKIEFIVGGMEDEIVPEVETPEPEPEEPSLIDLIVTDKVFAEQEFVSPTAAVAASATLSAPMEFGSDDEPRPYEAAKDFVLNVMRDSIEADAKQRNKRWETMTNARKTRYVNRARDVVRLNIDVADLINQFPNLDGYIDRIDRNDFR